MRNNAEELVHLPLVSTLRLACSEQWGPQQMNEEETIMARLSWSISYQGACQAPLRP